MIFLEATKLYLLKNFTSYSQKQAKSTEALVFPVPFPNVKSATGRLRKDS